MSRIAPSRLFAAATIPIWLGLGFWMTRRVKKLVSASTKEQGDFTNPEK